MKTNKDLSFTNGPVTTGPTNITGMPVSINAVNTNLLDIGIEYKKIMLGYNDDAGKVNLFPSNANALDLITVNGSIYTPPSTMHLIADSTRYILQSNNLGNVYQIYSKLANAMTVNTFNLISIDNKIRIIDVTYASFIYISNNRSTSLVGFGITKAGQYISLNFVEVSDTSIAVNGQGSSALVYSMY